MSKIHIFVSYSHEDDLWVQEGAYGLIPWLSRALRNDNVEFWCDPELRKLPGVEYKEIIHGKIENAHFAMLLISQNFLISDFVRQFEMPWIRERVERKELFIIPVLVGPVVEEEDQMQWFRERQMLPGKPTPLIEYIKDQAAWESVRVEILSGTKRRIREVRQMVKAHTVTEATQPVVTFSKPEELVPRESGKEAVHPRCRTHLLCIAVAIVVVASLIGLAVLTRQFLKPSRPLERMESFRQQTEDGLSAVEWPETIRPILHRWERECLKLDDPVLRNNVLSEIRLMDEKAKILAKPAIRQSLQTVADELAKAQDRVSTVKE